MKNKTFYVVKRIVVIQRVKTLHFQRITWDSVLDYFLLLIDRELSQESERADFKDHR